MQSDNIVVVVDDFKKDNLNSTVIGNTMEDDDKECEPRATTSTATTVGSSAANGLTNRKPYYGLTKLLVKIIHFIKFMTITLVIFIRYEILTTLVSNVAIFSSLVNHIVHLPHLSSCDLLENLILLSLEADK